MNPEKEIEKLDLPDDEIFETMPGLVQKQFNSHSKLEQIKLALGSEPMPIRFAPIKTDLMPFSMDLEKSFMPLIVELREVAQRHGMQIDYNGILKSVLEDIREQAKKKYPEANLHDLDKSIIKMTQQKIWYNILFSAVDEDFKADFKEWAEDAVKQFKLLKQKYPWFDPVPVARKLFSIHVG